MYELGQTAFEQGKYGDADREFTRLIQGHKLSRFVPYAHLRRAAANYNLKNYQKTADDYIVLVTHYPTHTATMDVLLPLQEALNLAGRSGDFDQYLAVYKTANPDSKGVEGVEFEAAKNLYFAQDYSRAIQRLAAYAVAYPESPRLSEAKFYESESYYRLKDYPNALKGYYTISGDDSFSMLSKAIARIAELEYRAGSYEKAVGAFQELSILAANKKEQYAAWSGLMESHYLLAQYDSADKYAHVILEKGNINAGAGNKASLYLGKTAMARGDYETAQDEFLHTLNTAQDEYGAEAKYLMAEIFYLTKQYKQCHETLLSLNKDFGAYTDWVGKSFLLLADNYAIQGELFQARGTLQSLVDNFPTQTVKDEAIEKIKKIDQVELEQKQEAAKDTVDNQ
jgi:TolA-binding protein